MHAAAYSLRMLLKWQKRIEVYMSIVENDQAVLSTWYSEEICQCIECKCMPAIMMQRYPNVSIRFICHAA